MMRPILIATALFVVACGSEEAESEEVTQENTETTDSDPDEMDDLVVENTTDLKSGVVGPFEIGALVPDLPEDLNSRIANHTVMEEGEEREIPVTVIYNTFEDMVDLQMEDSDAEHHEDLHIVEIMVHSSHYQTEMGIGVGSSIEDFAAAYPDYDIWYTYVSERYVLESPTLIGVQFLLDSHDCIHTPLGESDHENLELNDFEQGSKIQAIRVY